MTDGWNWRPSDRAVPPGHPPAAPSGASPWWSDGHSDPWRDPYTPTMVVVRPEPVEVGRPEPVSDPSVARTPKLSTIFLVALVTAVLAGMLGGSLGYAFAVRNGVDGGTMLGAPAGEGPGLARRPPDSLAGVAARLLPSVVTVRASGSVGSGFVVSSDGYVITNDHVIGAGSDSATVVFADGSTARARVVGQEPESDIAVLRVAREGLVPVEFGDSDAVAVGDPVLAFGAPLALSNTVTAGIISALDRAIQVRQPGGGVRYYAAIQTDAAVNRGNSGGPLVDGAGRVVGVNSVISTVAADEEEAGNIGLAFAIPINQAKRITLDIIETGQARRTVIGAQVGNTGRNSTAGVRLSAVDPAGPAAAAGLRAGDVILKIDGHRLSEAGDLIALVRKHAPGSVVTVEYRRGTAQHTAVVTLAADHD